MEGTDEPESQQNGGKINTPLQLEQHSKHHFFEGVEPAMMLANNPFSKASGGDSKLPLSGYGKRPYNYNQPPSLTSLFPR